jgi:uncharacterized RDD family membrane protein YckC
MHPHGRSGRYAGVVSRLLAFVIDLCVIAVVLAAAYVGLSVVEGFFRRIEWVGVAVDAVRILMAPVGAMLYFVACWALTGITVGNALVGVQVLRTDGRHVGVLRSLVRYVGLFVSAAAFGLGFAWVLVDKKRQGWHDKLAGTCVVYTHLTEP